MRYILMILMMVSFACEARAPFTLTPSQERVLTLALQVGAEYGLAEVLPGLVFRESSLGRLTTDSNGKHFGVGHVNLATARHVARLNTSLGVITAARLRSDAELGLRVAALYLLECQETFPDIQHALVCYNGGPRHARKFTQSRYSRLVMRHNQEIKQYLAHHDRKLPAKYEAAEIQLPEVEPIQHQVVLDVATTQCHISVPKEVGMQSRWWPFGPTNPKITYHQQPCIYREELT